MNELNTKKLFQYIKNLRSMLTTILDGVPSNDKRCGEHAILHNEDIINTQDVLEATKDFESICQNSNSDLLLAHICWLEDNFPDGEQEMRVAQALRDSLGLKTHHITIKDDKLSLGDSILLVRQTSGDADTIDATKPNMQHLFSCLSELYQTNDSIRRGDRFSLGGEIIAQCIDEHVEPIQKPAVVVLTNYVFGDEEIAMLKRDYHVQIVDESGSPHFVVYKGTSENLKKMIRVYWTDWFENEGDIDAAIGNWPYLASWGEGYGKPETRLVPFSFFNEENGYEDETQDSLRNMKPGMRLDLSDLSGVHFVKRLY